MSLRSYWFIAVVALAFALGCSDDTTDTPMDGGNDAGTDAVADKGGADKKCVKPDKGAPPSCAKNKMPVFKGKYGSTGKEGGVQVVISKLQLGGLKDGFDLNNDDCDNDVTTGIDNVLWVIGAIANPSLQDSMKQGEIAIPFEFFDLDDATKDDCLNYSLYVGRFPLDADGDGEDAGGPTNKPGKDCNDNDKEIGPKKKEVAGNGVDDDCDGKADESGTTPSTDTKDSDKDGQTIADGDCDDRAGKGDKIKKGGTEVCGDGLDNDCNGKADDGCLPWTKGMTFPVESLGLNSAQTESIVTFKGASIKGGKLLAGPSTFAVKVEIDKNIYIDLNLTHVFIKADMSASSAGLAMKNGILGGVLSGRVMGGSPNLLSDFYGTKEDTLLDVLLGPIGSTLGLPKDKDGNNVPDVDTDGDGIEKFLDKDLDGDTKNFRVDTCVDGDGTIVKNTYDASKKIVTRCTSAKDSKGTYRFVDGWSISLKFDASPASLKGIVKTKTGK